MATYSINNFLASVVPGDTKLKIYDKSNQLKYEINPNVAYFFTKSNVVIIRIEDKNDIYLDFIDAYEASEAAKKLNIAKKEILPCGDGNVTPGAGTLSDNEKKKLSYFHALSKSMISNTQKDNEIRYKSSHNLRMSDIWMNDIIPCETYNDAVYQTTINPALTIHSGVTLTEIPNSNGQTWYYQSGSTFIRPWISPVDIPFPNTYLPSSGFELKLFRGDDATVGIPGSEISQLEGAWIPDYNVGIIHFGVGNTPLDLGWGHVKSTFFQYTGSFGMSGLTNSFTSVYFDPDTALLIFNSGLSNETIIDLSSLKTQPISYSNIKMTAETTTGDRQLACDTGLISIPTPNSLVCVYVNGVQVNIGNGDISDECYFSNDGGYTAKSWSNIESGDKLYWNGTVAGYQLNSVTDKISFIYLTS